MSVYSISYSLTNTVCSFDGREEEEPGHVPDPTYSFGHKGLVDKRGPWINRRRTYRKSPRSSPENLVRGPDPIPTDLAEIAVPV